MTQPIEPTLFDKNNQDGWKQHLEDEGYVVITDILTPIEREDGLSIFKQDMSNVSPRFNFDDTSTWSIDTCPLMFGKGMAVFNGFGQSDFMWHLRTNATIQTVFKDVYSTDELVSSLDGFSMFISKTQKSKPWLHIDEHPNNELFSIQGAYNYFPVKDIHDAGFILVPGSHKTYKPEVKNKSDWHVCSVQPVDESRKLIIPENCLVLWNSRTIHANQGMTKPGIELNRLTCYVTFQPKHLRPDNILSKRIAAYTNGDATSHYANRCDVKRYPYGFKTRYESRNFNKLKPRLLDETIPQDRLALL